MGKVFTTITVTNRADQILARNGVIPEAEIRSITLENVLVDTGATTLCLPASVVEQLGLELAREITIETAMGIGTARIFQDAKLSISGRDGTFECLELPGGSSALVGVIPLEAMGLEPDLKNQTLRVLPIDSTETYLTIL